MFALVFILLIIFLKETLTKEKEFNAVEKMSLTRINVNMFYLFVDLPVLRSMISENICHYVRIQKNLTDEKQKVN